MELCHAVATTIGKLCLEEPQPGRVFGALLLSGLGRRMKDATADRHLPNVFRDESMGDVSRWIRQATRSSGDRSGEELRECLLSAFSDMQVHVRKVVGAAETVQCYALMALCTFYVHCKFGTDKPRGAARVVQLLTDAGTGLFAHTALMDALLPVLHPTCPTSPPDAERTTDTHRWFYPGVKVLHTVPEDVSLASSLYALHMEALYVCALVALSHELEVLPPCLERVRDAAADMFVDLHDRVHTVYAPEALAMIAEYRTVPEGAYLKPPPYRTRILDAMCRYLERRRGTTLDMKEKLAL